MARDRPPFRYHKFIFVQYDVLKLIEDTRRGITHQLYFKLSWIPMHQYTILIMALMIMLAVFAFQMFSTYGFMGFEFQ